MTTRRIFATYPIAFALLAAGSALGADWPQFRGPTGDGLATDPGAKEPVGIPVHWSEQENITWKTAIPNTGWSSPVVMGGQVWLTSATEDGHDFFAICVDADSGKILLNKKLFHCENPEPLGNPLNGYASPSPVIGPGRVYINFGSYGTACLDTQTFETLWQRTDLPCRHYRGPGSSVILFEDLLILTMDGVDVQYVAALNKATGQTVWKTDRTADYDDLDEDGKPFSEGDLRKAYSTPLVIDVDGSKLLLTLGSKAVYGYDPRTGAELWKINVPAFSATLRPVYDGNLAYVASGHGRSEMMAIDPRGRGDITKTAVKWKTPALVPLTPSPVLIEGRLFTINDTGIAVCLDAATGERLWRQRIRGRYAASLLYADGNIYCFSHEGKTTVFKATGKYEQVAENTLDSGCMASAAVAGKALFVRTKEHLYRIESN